MWVGMSWRPATKTIMKEAAVDQMVVVMIAGRAVPGSRSQPNWRSPGMKIPTMLPTQPPGENSQLKISPITTEEVIAGR